MATETNRENLLRVAVSIFSIKGYHGTAMRDIAGEAGCSLPTLYYHFKSKENLFNEIVCTEFFKLLDRLNAALDFTAHPVEVYTQVIRQRKELNTYDKAVYRLAMKVWLGFEDLGEARAIVSAWEKGRTDNTRKMLAGLIGDETVREDFIALFLGVMENMMERVLLLDEDIPEEDVIGRLTLLFRLV